MSPKISRASRLPTEPSPNFNNLDSTDLDEQFSLQEVEATIFSNNNHKSLDGIKPMFIKNQACVRYPLQLMHGLKPNLFQRLAGPVDYPWSTGVYIPPIIYCRILNTRLRDYLEANEAVSDEQNGFRPTPRPHLYNHIR